MGQKVQKKVNFANVIQTRRRKSSTPLIKTVEGKRGDVFIRSKAHPIPKINQQKESPNSILRPTRIPSKLASLRQTSCSPLKESKESLYSEACPLRTLTKQYGIKESLIPSQFSIDSKCDSTRKTKVDNEYAHDTSLIASDESIIHSKSCLLKYPRQSKSKYHATCANSEITVRPKSCPTRSPPNRQTERKRRSRAVSTESIHSKYCPMRLEFDKNDNDYFVPMDFEEESIHSLTCPLRSHIGDKNVHCLPSEAAIHDKSCPMRSKPMQKHESKYPTRTPSEESTHSMSCPLFESKQRKNNTSNKNPKRHFHLNSCPMRVSITKKRVAKQLVEVSSEESMHSISCPMFKQKKIKKEVIRETSEDSVHSETCPLRLQRKPLAVNYAMNTARHKSIYQSLDRSSQESIPFESSPKRSQGKLKRAKTSSPDYSERFMHSKNCPLKIQKVQKTSQNMQSSAGKTYWKDQNGTEDIIQKQCLNDFKRMTRYLQLKQKAIEAMNNKKIFTVKGKNATAVRKALVDRGWVEKVKINKNDTYTNETTIEDKERLILSSFLEEYNPNLVWGGSQFEDINREDGFQDHEDPIRNTLKVVKFWSTKARLCESINDTSWYYIENVADVYAPRTYSNNNNGELKEFINDYNLTACTSLLTWIINRVQERKPILKNTGRIPINIIVFAINRCKEFLFKKENLDVDKKVTKAVTQGQWKYFLTKYHALINEEDIFENDKDRNLPLLIAYATCLLAKIIKYRPQLKSEGCNNVWIMKPSESSGGKGILLSSDIDKILNTITKRREPYVVQKYIEDPLLIYETKFDIRQYFLVTNTYPLEIWMYTDCFMKFCSQKYSLKTLNESVHLTNQTIQRRYRNDPTRHSGLPRNNLCDLNTFKNYLKDIGKENVWDDVIYPGMKKTIVGIMLSNQDFLTNSRNRFGFYGCDFILDKDFKPWLIEINNAPDLNPSTEAKICHRVISDIIKVVVDNAQNSEASTGNFEFVYRQPMTPLQNEDSMNNFEVKGVSLKPENFLKPEEESCNKHEQKETVTQLNTEDPKNQTTKRLSPCDPTNIPKQPVLNLLQKLDSLFELAVIKKPGYKQSIANMADKKTSPFVVHTESGTMTLTEDFVNMRTFSHDAQTDDGSDTLSEYEDKKNLFIGKPKVTFDYDYDFNNLYDDPFEKPIDVKHIVSVAEPENEDSSILINEYEMAICELESKTKTDKTEKCVKKPANPLKNEPISNTDTNSNKDEPLNKQTKVLLESNSIIENNILTKPNKQPVENLYAKSKYLQMQKQPIPITEHKIEDEIIDLFSYKKKGISDTKVRELVKRWLGEIDNTTEQ